ncbi:hypothetical protein [Pseudolysinimonas sp.]
MKDFFTGEELPDVDFWDLAPRCDHDDDETLVPMSLAEFLRDSGSVPNIFGKPVKIVVCVLCWTAWHR